MTSPLLDMVQVSRRLGGREVVRDLSLGVGRGEVVGLLGVNGAGKSTTMAMLAGALRPSRGRIRIDGLDLEEHPRRARSAIGWLPERAPLWPELTVDEHLAAAGRLRGLRAGALRQAARGVLQRLHLESERARLAGVLSQGQRQRLGLACALLHAPDLLVLDEPANGLDPMQAADLRSLLRERAASGCAIILSTHLLPEVTAVCERVLILHEGRLRHDAPLRAIQSAVQVHLGVEHALDALRGLAPVASAEAVDNWTARVALRKGHHSADLARAVVEAGLPLAGLHADDGDLERTFMHIAARTAEAA